LDGRTINWSAFEPQHADEEAIPFSFATDRIYQPQLDCFIGYTTTRVHDAIRSNLGESPLYSGKIKGVGPRYCPSIEDKVVKFAAKDRHQLFLEPEGHETNEVYLNGFSTSLPAELQQDLVRLIPGLEEAKIIRPGYAIEYDFVDPRELRPDLQTARIAGLFHAGQINGTTGYEEAACQGLIAGMNAAFFCQKRKSFRLRREESYIGVLVDDLITQGVDEPYRVFTSRAENRLALRYDNADERLEPYGRQVGLVGDTDWERFNCRRDRLTSLGKAMRETRLRRSDPAYVAVGIALGADLGDSITLEQLGQRSGVTPEILRPIISGRVGFQASNSEIETVMADSLYEGYICHQQSTTTRLRSHDSLVIPSGFDYREVSGLSAEMVERLERAEPQTFGDARKVRGLTSAGLSSLLVNLNFKDKAA
jgi:tRNA uridine 5-carboxymethylaminomethyl modification enzyme